MKRYCPTSGSMASSPDGMYVVYEDAKKEIEELRREVRYLRAYGNTACTAMADAAMRAGELNSEKPA